MSKHSDLLNHYISSISSKFSHEETSEMGYRTDFEVLIKGIFEEINVRRIDHDAKAKDGNKPDFAVLKNDIPILYIEAKDIGVSLDKVEKSEQMSRYYGYTNLVLTDYLEFRFYRNGLPYGEPIKVATYDIKRRSISSVPEQYDNLARTLIDFTVSKKEPIQSGKHLSKIMGGRAQRIRDNVKAIFETETGKSSELHNVYITLKRLLVHDLTKDSFADMYAQTLVYGLFIARYYDNTPETFSRQEARDLIPASNPFLGDFFDHIAGRNFEKRLSYIVDELCEVFTHANVSDLMEQHFRVISKKGTQRGQDQVIHFYEDFLKEYDDVLRKKMGAYYTPLPVVQFIVRSVDFLLEKEFGLANGLANTSKMADGTHRVQVLDPAVGTGTFISDVIGKIYTRILESGQRGSWPSYVHHDLLPRISGFELMMAPYTIAHLKLSMALKETGFLYFNETKNGKARLGIYLTNSLEEVNKQPELLAFDFGASIAEEAKEASKIKNDRPIMVVVGNPPYSISSSNKGDWIQNLIKVYKDGLNEQNTNSLSDDYVKFIRFAEHFIEKNESGIVAMITNNSFLDGITHRQMRKHLLETFDDIYILNLHGDVKSKESTFTKGTDENVFDIQQGVSINIFVRKAAKKEILGTVNYSDLFGKRIRKFEELNNSNLKNIKWKEIKYSNPYYFFTPKDFDSEETYKDGFKLDESFIKFSAGTKFRKDGLLVKNHFSRESVLEMLNDMHSLPKSTLTQKYKFKETNDWQVDEKRNLFVPDDKNNIRQVLYKPFDYRWTYYPVETINKIIPRGDSRLNLMKHFMNHSNLGIITNRQIVNENWSHVVATNTLSAHGTFYLGNKGQDYVFPLYLFHDDGSRSLNIKSEIVDNIEKIVGDTKPEEIFDYIYSVLHSPKYRVKFKGLLKIDFPRIPYPSSKNTFLKLVELGKELRMLHLFESEKINKPITTYPVAGSNIVDKTEYKVGNVYINSDQYFGNIPEVSWNFYTGGYQPAQKWLKDRKGQNLTYEDIEHYQKIIVALAETDKIMKEIDKEIYLK